MQNLLIDIRKVKRYMSAMPYTWASVEQLSSGTGIPKPTVLTVTAILLRDQNIEMAYQAVCSNTHCSLGIYPEMEDYDGAFCHDCNREHGVVGYEMIPVYRLTTQRR